MHHMPCPSHLGTIALKQNYYMHVFISQFSKLDADTLPQMPEINHREVHVGFVRDKIE